MSSEYVKNLRKSLGLTQEQFARLFDVHAMTVSKWERGEAVPTPYQAGLMQRFEMAAKLGQEALKKDLQGLLVTAGVIAALAFLLGRS